jgi:hypothetical protein
MREDGTVTVRGYISIPTDRAWFFTPEWLAGEREAGEQIAAGRGRDFDSAEEMFAHLDALTDEDPDSHVRADHRFERDWRKLSPRQTEAFSKAILEASVPDLDAPDEPCRPGLRVKGCRRLPRRSRDDLGIRRPRNLHLRRLTRHSIVTRRSSWGISRKYDLPILCMPAKKSAAEGRLPSQPW